MKIKKILLGLVLVILLICLIPINLQSTRILTNLDSDLKTSQTNETIDYKFEKNILDTSNKTNINLRHNNVITGDYNGTYSFANDINGNVPIGWNNLSVGNGRTVALITTIDKHHAIARLKTIDTDDAQIEQEFDDGTQTEGIIEFWFRTSEATNTAHIRVFSGATEVIKIRNTGDVFQIYESGSPITLDTIPYDNVWYHFNIYFDCILDIANISINGYYEGSFDFNIASISVDTLDFLNSGIAGGWVIYFDAIGYSWSSNYTIGENEYPNIEIVDSDILTSDMYQFNFDSYGNAYTHMEYDIHGWTTIQTANTFIDFPTLHYYRFYPNESIKSKNVVRIVSHTSGAGIKNDSLNLYLDKINISFGLEFNSIDSIIQHSFNITVKSRDNIEIIKIAFIPISITEVEMLYFDNTAWILLEIFDNISPFDTYDFNLYLNDFNVSLLWYKNGVFNNSHSFPYIIDRNGVNSLSFIVYDSTEDSYYLVMKIQDVGIYQYNISQTLEYGCIRYNFKNTWNFSTHNLFNFTSNDFSKIITYIYDTAFDYYWIRYAFDQSIFYNMYNIEVKLYTNLWIITNNININSVLLIEGVKMIEYIDNAFFKEYIPRYLSFNINENNSYFYVDNNQLEYKLHLTLNYTYETIIIFFDIYHRGVDNATLILGGRETLTCFGKTYFMIEYLGFQNPTRIDLADYYSMYYEPLPFARVIDVFVFTTNDFMSNYTFTGFVYHGFLDNLKIIYGDFLLPGYSEWTITILTLMAIMIPLIVIVVPTFAIHSVYKKKEAIIPMLMLFTIIAFATVLIPFQVFFVIMVALGCGIFLQYKRESGG